MKAHFIKVGLEQQQTFFIKKIDQRTFSSPFHFHDLCEMNFVVESSGKTIVGDNVSNFSSGDLVLMSSSLPHIWHNDPSYFVQNDLPSAKAIVTYFTPDFLTDLIGDSLYNQKVRTLLNKAKRGIRYYGKTRENARRKLIGIDHKNALEKIIDFLTVINMLLEAEDYEFLASVSYQNSFNDKDTQRMNDVYQFLMQNFTESVSLNQIASVANMTPPAFSSFFKKKTQKRFSTFLNELRIGHACKLLADPELSISDVCFQSGYQNPTNFNDFFKRITHKTPSQYRKEYSSQFKC